jgi:hypothetical protein
MPSQPPYAYYNAPELPGARVVYGGWTSGGPGEMDLGGEPFTTLPPGAVELGGIPFTTLAPDDADLGGEPFTPDAPVEADLGSELFTLFPPGVGDGTRIDLEPPSPVILELVRPAAIVLTWSAYPRQVTGYRVYHALDNGAVEAIEDEVQSTGYAYEAATPGTHRFSISALIGEVESQLSPLASITLTEADVLPAPVAPSVEKSAPSSLDVVWDAFGTISLAVTGFELWHRFEDGEWGLVDVFGASTFCHRFATIQEGTHAFRIRVRFAGDDLSLFSPAAEVDMTASDIYEPTWIYASIAPGGSYQMPIQPTDEQAVAASVTVAGSYQMPIQPSDEQTISSSITVSGSYVF